jgi:predicted transposase/invertase (TIGR01784 family)
VLLLLRARRWFDIWILKEQYLKIYRDLKNVIDTAFDEGKQEGILEGRLEGKLEEKLDLARALKDSGVPLEVIAKTTGLALEQIMAL